jgi:hypothetical protein
MIIKVLKGSRLVGLDKRFRHFLSEVVNANGAIAIEDPANAGNDVGETLKGLREGLAIAAGGTLLTADRNGWSAVFGSGTPVSREASAAALRISVTRSEPSRPWRKGN